MELPPQLLDQQLRAYVRPHVAAMLAALDNQPTSFQTPGLCDGLAGHSLLQAYYAYLYEQPQAGERAGGLLQQALDSIDRQPSLGMSLADGLIGISWTINHLQQHELLYLDTAALLNQTDTLAYTWAQKQLRAGQFDYLHAGMGAIFYLFDRLDQRRNVRLLRGLGTTLLAQADAVEWGLAWPTPPTRPGQVARYNLSVSHGLLSILAVLSWYAHHDILAIQARQTASQVVELLIKHLHSDTNALARLPSTLATDGRLTYSNRMAWCYGDLGASLVLDQVGERLHWPWLRSIAQDLALKETRRHTAEEAQLNDASLCHGYAGAAWLFKRWHERTSHPAFATACVRWVQQIVAAVPEPAGWADYQFWLGPRMGWQRNPGLLDGLSGVALSLISLTPNKQQFPCHWDRMLLL